MKLPTHNKHTWLLGAGIALGAGAWAAPLEAATPEAEAMPGMDVNAMHQGAVVKGVETRALPAMPSTVPSWLDSNKNHEMFYRRGPYNFAIYDIDALARDMNGVAVGHSLAYEALVTGREKQLETTVFEQIDRVLKNPPRLMPAERILSPTFARRYGTLELVFDWTHVSHAQTIDNFVSTWADNATKDAETTRLWNYYRTQGKPFLITGLPMNMAWLDAQPYSGAFRQKYPKVNALFWGYHWLQTSVYDGLRGKTLAEQKRVYEQMGQRYRTIELYDTKRPFMPMMAETSPRFSAQFPEIANGFDNLHMLHDMVNDILASTWMSQAQKQEQIKRAIYIMAPDAHRDCTAGENRGVIDGIAHDHRFMEGMPGMGMMKDGGATDPSNTKAAPTSAANTQSFDPTKLMWMNKMGWMNMSQCHHCSMPLSGKGDDPASAWKNSTVSAEGWTMRVRCALCARDMSAEVKGAAILDLATEDPQQRVVVFADAQGNLTTNYQGAVFLEDKGGHARCSQWSQAFSNRAAFDAFVKQNPRYADAKALTFEQWASVDADGTPDTYEKEVGPVENPYAADLKARGIEAEEVGSR